LGSVVYNIYIIYKLVYLPKINFVKKYLLTFKKLNISKSKGFTLLELLIVIGIIAILSVALVFVLNPAEALKKARDSQRMSDLNTLKKAIGIYTTTIASPKMAGADNTGCKGTVISDASYTTASDHIYYSYPSDIGGVNASAITATKIDGVNFSAGGVNQVTKSNLGNVNGTGWLPIDFSTLSGGSPISALPIDPVNTIADKTNPTMTDLVYRYVCSEKTLKYEINATLESTAFTLTDLKMASDGGNNDSYYEVGTNLDIFNMESPLVAGTYTIVGQDHLPYKTVIAEDGLEWLDRNLGATQVATAYNDYKAYGSLFQWGRGADGHEKINWTSSTSGTAVNGVTSGPVNTDTPGSSFVTVASVTPWDWRTGQNNNLWQGVNGTNNPCPSGFKLPTTAQWQTLAAAIPNFQTGSCGGTSFCREAGFNSTLKLTSGGYRDFSSAGLNSLGSYGFYWSSSPVGVYAYFLYFYSTAVYPAHGNYRAYGFSVRCVKD
jgi:uncharacterized protein (TIGR02145 family)/prepilin-type N-terminal cleavage/methylation domain-containing protein